MNYISKNKKNENIKNPPKKGQKRKVNIIYNKNTNIKKDSTTTQDDKYSKSLNMLKSESTISYKRTPYTKPKISKTKKPFTINKNNLSILKVKKKKINIDSGNIDIEEYLKPDLDDLEYDDAIKLDKREFSHILLKN